MKEKFLETLDHKRSKANLISFRHIWTRLYVLRYPATGSEAEIILGQARGEREYFFPTQEKAHEFYNKDEVLKTR